MHAGSEYEGLFAEFYDILHDHAREAPALVELAAEAGGPVLELGCGTGRLLLPLARAGLFVTGVDGSPDMLELCRAKLAREPAAVRTRVRLLSGDLADFTAGGPFGLAFLACNTANHLLTVEAAVRCFCRAAEHLRPGGLFVVDNSVPDPDAMAEEDGVEQVSEHIHPETGLQLVCRFTPRYDFDRQRERDVIDLEERNGTEVTRRIRAETELTWFTPRELVALLERAGHEVEGVYGSLRRAPFSAESREMIVISRRPEAGRQ